MEDNYQGFFKGQFLIAMPGMTDPNFFQTVICISEHTQEGAVGIVVNRPHPAIVGKDIFDELKINHVSDSESIPIYIGGPVHVGEIFVLHGPPFNWESCLMVTPSLAMSNSRDIIEVIAMGEGPEACIVSVGCAGWGEGQLESEIKENVWLTCPISEKIIFEIPGEYMWEEAVKKMGIDPGKLSDIAGHA
ncbi:MAG TPA: YqgE/AlgH family protein [Anaerolineae bacterium]|nr:YqgE/AlgH family protein [Anaerolineae bacterium]